MIQEDQMLNDLKKEREILDTVIEYITRYHNKKQSHKSIKTKQKKVLKHVRKRMMSASARRKMSIAAKRRHASGVYNHLKKN